MAEIFCAPGQAYGERAKSVNDFGASFFVLGLIRGWTSEGRHFAL